MGLFFCFAEFTIRFQWLAVILTFVLAGDLYNILRAAQRGHFNTAAKIDG